MRNSVLYHALAPYPSGSLRDVDSIGGVTKSRAVNPPRWLVWAGGSLLITAREQIRGRFLTQKCYTIRPERVKTNVGCSRNSLADCQLIPWEASPTREARYITLAATKPSGVDTCILKSGDTGFDTRIHRTQQWDSFRLLLQQRNSSCRLLLGKESREQSPGLRKIAFSPTDRSSSLTSSCPLKSYFFPV